MRIHLIVLVAVVVGVVGRIIITIITITIVGIGVIISRRWRRRDFSVFPVVIFITIVGIVVSRRWSIGRHAAGDMRSTAKVVGTTTFGSLLGTRGWWRPPWCGGLPRRSDGVTVETARTSASCCIRTGTWNGIGTIRWFFLRITGDRLGQGLNTSHLKQCISDSKNLSLIIL